MEARLLMICHTEILLLFFVFFKVFYSCSNHSGKSIIKGDKKKSVDKFPLV